MGRYIGYEVEKISSWEKEEIGVEWIFDVVRKNGVG